MVRRLLVPLLVVATTGLVGCPRSSRPPRSASTVVELAVGRFMDKKIVKERGLVRAPRVAGYLERLGRTLARRSSRPHLTWRFRLTDEDRLGASVLAGGYVYVTRGLLVHLNHEAELAALLCHEIGHVEARHHLFRGEALWSIAEKLRVLQRNRFDLDAHWAWLRALMPRRPYAQQLEADHLAVRCLRRNGYPVRALLHLLRFMRDHDTHEFLSAGPRASKRHLHEWAVRIRRLRRALGPTAERPLRPDPAFLRRLGGLAVPPVPRRGVLAGRRYLHPQGGFGVTVPRGWTSFAAPDRLLATAPGGGATLLVYRSGESNTDRAVQRLVSAARPVALRELRSGVTGTRGGAYRLDSGQRIRAVAWSGRKGVFVAALVGAGADAKAEDRAWSETLRSLHLLPSPLPVKARPWRLRARRARRSTTLSASPGCRVPTSGLKVLRAVNRRRSSARIRAGQWFKCVVR